MNSGRDPRPGPGGAGHERPHSPTGMRILTRAISGGALLLALAFSGRAGAADAPAQPKADEQLMMPKMVVQGTPICSFGISLKILGDTTTKKITRIFISEVISGSRAEFIGLRPGDEILAVNGLKIAELK